MAVAKRPEHGAKELPLFMVLKKAQGQPGFYVGLAENENSEIRPTVTNFPNFI
jgi:hypothetical protein